MFKKVIKSFFSVLVLTSLVLGITMLVKGVSDINEKKIVSLASKIGIEGQVAGIFAKRPVRDLVLKVVDDVVNEDKEVLLKVALLADSENDYDSLYKALEKIKPMNVAKVILLGDLTGWGDLGSMQKVKDYMDKSSLDYVAIPGDHDLAESVGNKDVSGMQNFTAVFSQDYHVLNIKGMKILVMNNSANYTTVRDSLMLWFKKEVQDSDFVMLSQPLYHPTNKRLMGYVDDVETEPVRKQALEMLDDLRKSNVRAVIAGDQHISSQNPDPVRPGLLHVVIGALTKERNLQTPRFSLLTVYSDKSFTIEDVIF